MKNFNDLVQKEFTNSKGFLSLGQMLIKTKQFDKAKDVFQVLLNNTSADNEKQLADIHRNLGYINEKLKDFSTALFHYEAQLRYLPSDHSSISSIYSCIGITHKNLGNLDQAFEYIICALRNDVHLPKPNAVIVSNHINNIGLIFKEQRRYTDALNCFERALKVQQKFLPPLSSIDTFNNIGELYLLIKDYSKAIQYFQEGLKIQQKSDSSPSAIVADIHNNLSIAFYNLGQSKDANEHASKAVNIATHLFGEKHDLLKKYQDQYNIVIQKK
jgi:tetratricopeptide (TPR) repeat protein